MTTLKKTGSPDEEVMKLQEKVSQAEQSSAKAVKPFLLRNKAC